MGEIVLFHSLLKVWAKVTRTGVTKIDSTDQQSVKKGFRTTVRRLLGYLHPHRKRFFLALGTMVIFGATDGAVPFVLRYVLDDIFGSHDKNMLWLLVSMIVLFGFIRAVFGFLQRYLSLSVGLMIVEDLRNEISDKLLQLSPGFYSAHSTGSLLSRMTNDTLLIRRGLTDGAVSILRDGIRVIALLAAALVLDPFLGVIAFFVFPLAILPIVKFGKKVRRLSRAGQEQLGGLTAILHNNIMGHKVVQAFCAEDHERQRFVDENARSTNNFLRAGKYGALSAPVNEILASIAIAVIVVYGGLSVIGGVRTQGDFVAFITAVLLLYEPLKKLSRVNTTIQTAVAAADRVFEVLDVELEITDSAASMVLSTASPKIEYQSVSFRYPAVSDEDSALSSTPLEVSQEDTWALSNVSLKLESGQTVALVGSSGGGKSTLVQLLPRFYDAELGEILIDGNDIRNYSLESLRQHISIVDQHTFLFDESFSYNISYGRFDATQEEVIAAAKAAHADEFIRELPNGYETMIGEQGVRLSGGQRARIAIARALLKDAPILILDEATASLDSESEKLVQEAIERLLVNRTVLVIAHRLSTIQNADTIAVLSKGKIVEQGTHQELIELSGEYQRLHALQFRYEQSNVDQRQAQTVNQGS